MPFTASKDFPVAAFSSAAAAVTFSHQTAGSCSAHPGRGESMASSFFGLAALPTGLPVAASMSDALIEELPRSNPSR